MAMLCHDWDAVAPAVEKVAAAYENHVFPRDEWDASRNRIEIVRQKIEKQRRDVPLSVVGCAEHRALADEIRARVTEKLRATRSKKS